MASKQKIRDLVAKKREVYDQYIKDIELHNLVIIKVNEKLATDVLANDVLHFKDILRDRYYRAINLLHECSDKIKELDKQHYDELEKLKN